MPTHKATNYKLFVSRPRETIKSIRVGVIIIIIIIIALYNIK